ncbi:hypothetical protein ACGF3G_27595 [Streptomyces sp. NPDC048179]|uniref:hypothetical protein n=1 Tax=Streptomyces sp. NPDC048179 TaxID=3365506 RepID=UPI00371D107F
MTQHFFDGQWQDPLSGATFDKPVRFGPSRVTHVRDSDLGDVNTAVSAAAQAGPGRGTSITVRRPPLGVAGENARRPL